MDAVKAEKITERSFEFMNRFGIILNNEVVIHQYNRTLPISLDGLRKIELRKIRRYRRNSFVLSIGMALFITPFLFVFPKLYFFTLCATGIASVITAMFIREYDYRLLIMKKHDFITLKVDKGNKDDAKNIAIRINKKIKNMRESDTFK